MPCNEIKSANPFPRKELQLLIREMGRKYNLEARIESNRPPVSAGRLERRLAGLALALRGVVAETQETFIYPACQLDNDALDELAVALVEFAEDIHAGIGLWPALENYQSEFFGTPLPLFLEAGEQLSGRFDPRRVRHFLYILWRQLKPDLILAPDHPDLTELAETVSEFLAAAFRGQPKDSGVARFLHTPNRRGWDINGSSFGPVSIPTCSATSAPATSKSKEPERRTSTPSTILSVSIAPTGVG